MAENLLDLVFLPLAPAKEKQAHHCHRNFCQQAGRKGALGPHVQWHGEQVGHGDLKDPVAKEIHLGSSD